MTVAAAGGSWSVTQQRYRDYSNSLTVAMSHLFMGKWEPVSTENLDAMMETLEVKEELRPLLRDALPTLEYDMEGDTWIMRLITPHFTKEYKFKSGEELSTHAIDGRDVKSVMTFSNGKMEEIYDYGDFQSNCTREVVGDNLIVTLVCKGVESKALHKKVS